MLVGIHQLHYLPWLRYLEKIHRSDVFIVLDNIQFNKNGWQNRNKVKTSAGSTLLTIPINAKAGQNLDEVRIDNETPWRRRHWRTIEQSYGKAPYFKLHGPFLEAAYAKEWSRLNELNRHMLDYYVAVLGIGTQIQYASDLGVPGDATGRLVNLIRAVRGDRYYSGAYAPQEYLDADLLDAAGIDLELQEWRAPVYPQRYGAFVPDLSIVDLLMNCGPGSLPILAP